MRFSPKIAGLVQATGLTFYVGLFAFSATHFEQIMKAGGALPPPPIFGMTLFLLAFIISALVCGGIAFAYPLSLFLKDKRKEAIRIVVWNVLWLAVFFSGLVIFLVS